MKNFIYKVVLYSFLSIIFIGCNEFLTTLPESSYSVAGAYQSQSDFEYAIAGVYAAQQDLYRSNGCWFRSIIARSDDTRNGGLYLDGLDQFTDNAVVPTLEGGYQTLWRMISRSNIILDKIEDIDFQDENLKNSIKGEAYALRAWSYYTLGWQFGGMPLIDKELNLEETKKIARSTQEETFAFVEADFKNAVNLLPISWSGKNAGRITKYAAEGGLARLYMFQSKFSQAKPHLLNVINSGLYQMEEQYVNCFTDSHDNGPERVWEIQFTGGLTGEGQYLSTGMLPEGYKDAVLMPFSGYSTAMYVSLNMAEAYEPGDVRKDVSLASNLLVNGVVQEAYSYILKYCHYDSYTPQNVQDWANNIPVIRYTDIKMMYAECLNEEGYVANGEAFTIINEVRQRAGLSPLTSAEVPDKEAFKQALIKERRVEFAFEGLRWNDLVRWGIARTVMNNHLMHEDEGGGIYQMDGDYREIFAIPFSEISRYDDETIMWQNPEY
jgi:starch-binding outer membrane protein, SusD/RagB family